MMAYSELNLKNPSRLLNVVERIKKLVVEYRTSTCGSSLVLLERVNNVKMKKSAESLTHCLGKNARALLPLPDLKRVICRLRR